MAEGLAQGLELGSQLRLGRHRRWRHPLGDGLEIQPTASHEQGDAAAGVFGGDGLLGFGAKLLQVDRLIGAAQIQQLMAGRRPLFRRGLGGADIHLLVELARIHRQHRQIQRSGQLDAEGRFAAGGGAQQHDHQGLGRGFGLAHPGTLPAGLQAADCTPC